MRDLMVIILGAGGGAVTAVMVIALAYLLPDVGRKAWGEFLAWVAHPVAIVIAAITRQPLQAESSLLIHIVAIVVTFTVVGALVGWLFCKI